MAVYLRPQTIDAALAALARQRLVVLAGGTDYFPARVGQPPIDDVLDVTAIGDLRGITDCGAHWRIGATTTWRQLIDADLPPLFDGLKLAAREVGGAQIQNAGTIAGNLCNASPAADGIPALLALDAGLMVANLGGSRVVALADFIRGNRRTALAADQLVTAIIVRKGTRPAVSHFLKLGARRYLVISIAMAAGTIELDRDHVVSARLAIGACSEIAQRLPLLERDLVEQRLDAILAGIVEDRHVADLQPIDDVRATASYRRQSARILLQRLVGELVRKAEAARSHG